jgi:diguanylate cyclase (GGDEF)-like protein
VVRWGGEEFLVYVDGPASAEHAAAFVKRLLEEIAASPVDVGSSAVPVTASAGFALVAPKDMAAFEKDIDAIDALLYRAKNEGRNRAMGRLGDDDVRCLRPAWPLGTDPGPA